jgi:pyridoxine kinase
MNENELFVLCSKLADMGPKKILISGLERGDSLENFVFEKGKDAEVIMEHKVGPFRSGTGDVFSSIIAADAVKGKEFGDSIRHASSFIAKVLRRTVELDLPKTDGICFEEFLTEI